MNAYELADELNRIVKVLMPLHYITESADMLRQQADRIADYEKWEKRWSERVARAENRIAELEKNLALKIRDRDVFREFTLAYEERIAELEKDLEGCEYFLDKQQNAEPVAWIAYDEFGDFMLEATKEGDYPWQPLYTKPQIKDLSDEEIIDLFEHPDDFNCIDFARAILKKASEK